jgi:NAD(P)-dependent dehydrogenase (short-subunit alcohol dehydrogenase family)
MARMRDRVVVVTGAAQGIGSAIALPLLRRNRFKPLVAK